MQDQNNPIFQPSVQPVQPQPGPGNVVAPGGAISRPASDPAVEMIRSKINALYDVQPGGQQNPQPIQTAQPAKPMQQVQSGSQHQQFMAGLQASGKSLSEIQAAWHSYYVGLDDTGKHQVWQEFYADNGSATTPAPTTVVPHQAIDPLPQHLRERSARRKRIATIHRASKLLQATISGNTPADIKRRVLRTVKTVVSVDGGGTLHKGHHLQSLLFGLGCGAVVIVIFLFSFFNEVIIAPFIQPSRKATSAPIIVNTASSVTSKDPKVIIPKINLEIPVDYSQTTTSESAIELALDNGIVHYPTTVKPGQIGNAAFFGHSSNNIFNPGKYKFAFVLLHELSEGDTFYLTNNGQTYAYRVFSKTIVKPTQVSVLGPVAGHAATATLITCDPPGTSINRLVVIGDQISPDPSGNGTAPTQTASNAAASGASSVASDSGLPGNGPGLWSRIISRIF